LFPEFAFHVLSPAITAITTGNKYERELAIFIPPC
jgi:hypothetical protein